MKKFILLTVVILFIISCNYYFDTNVRKNYSEVNKFLRSDSSSYTFLKAHLRNGDVVIFERAWKLSADSTQLTGRFVEHYNVNRSLIRTGKEETPVSEIVLIETNSPLMSQDASFYTGLGILTLGNVLITAYCISNPKACWGSCPTFYFNDDEHLFFSRAEGFSSSIAPCMEKGDIDALDNPEIHSRQFRLYMKNEAFETHAINKVGLMAVPRQKGTRAYHDINDNFYICDVPTPVHQAFGPEGDLFSLLKAVDGIERFSKTDGEDLNAKENLELIFRPDKKGTDKGIVLDFRQSLLPTFLFYSAMSYMGDEASDVLAGVETNPFMKKKLEASLQHLGGIEVATWNEQLSAWQKIQTLFEAGPIARNMQLIPLPTSFSTQKEIKIRLTMSKGLWRLDYAGLTNIIKPVEPACLEVVGLDKNGKSDGRDLQKLQNDDNNYLLSLPGDVFGLTFQLPATADDYELFVYSKGYYLEWIRKEWLGGKDRIKLRKMVLGDPRTWRELAREYKQLEPSMESTFWNSRVSL